MKRLRNEHRDLEPKKQSKSGWIKTHYLRKELLGKSHTFMVVTADSIVAGPRH